MSVLIIGHLVTSKNLMFHVSVSTAPDRLVLDSTFVSMLKLVGWLQMSINCVSEGSIRGALEEKGEARKIGWYRWMETLEPVELIVWTLNLR